MNVLFNHLWQSTVFAVAIAVICFVLRSNHPRIRCWIWLAASVKFLVPFSLLVSLGDRLDLTGGNPPLTAMTVERISTTFAPAPILAAPVYGKAKQSGWLLALGIIWALGAAFIATRWFRRWLRLRAAMQGANPLPLNLPVSVLVTRSLIEPGIVGLLRPVLLVPEGLIKTLTPVQFQAIIAHELCHVRERDNLFAAMHMVVETVFWFHPLIWWIGARLIEERERACDESVIAQGNSADDYAAGILSVCKFFLESPLPCVAGITGSDLKKRIREIMASRLSEGLTLTRKAFLTVAACALCAVPVVIGILRAQTLPPPPAYGYEVVSIRPSEPGQQNSTLGPGPQGGLRGRNQTVLNLLRFAYNLQEFQFANIPGWVKSARYDVVLTPDKPEITPSPAMKRDEVEGIFNRQRQRMQAVLRDRFGLVLRAETKEQPMYALVVARNGHKLRQPNDASRGPHLSTGRSQVTGTSAYVSQLVNSLSTLLERHVSDETGLDGQFDFAMQWTSDTPPNPEEPANITDSSGASLFTALTDQLGLKLEPKKGQVPVFVIEKIERPSEN